MTKFYEGQWVKNKGNGKIGWVALVPRYPKNRVRVQYVGLNFTLSINKEDLVDYEGTLDEVRKDLIDDSLDNKAKDWFDYICKGVS